MSNRITNAMLEFKLDYIKRLTGNDRLEIDHYNPGGNPYQYHLAEVNTENYGVRFVDGMSRKTKREFYAYLCGMIDAIEMANR